MDNANSILLNRFFTRNTFKEVIDEGESSAYIAAIRRYIVDSANKTNDECISEIYQYLRKEYQNEYYYRNLLGGLYRENPVKSRNYEAVKSSKKWENVGNSYIIPALLLYRYSYI